MAEPYRRIKHTALDTRTGTSVFLREKYGRETIGVFGSIKRGEDRPDSDVDIPSPS